MRITLAGPQGLFNCYFLISLVLTFGVNHQDLVVGENDAARVYPIPEIRIHSIYISPDIINIKYHFVKEWENIAECGELGSVNRNIYMMFKLVQMLLVVECLTREVDKCVCFYRVSTSSYLFYVYNFQMYTDACGIFLYQWFVVI